MAFWLMVLALGLAAHALISNRALRRRAEGLERRLAALERGLDETRRPEADLSPPAGTEAPWDASAALFSRATAIREGRHLDERARFGASIRSSEASSRPDQERSRASAPRRAPDAGLAAWLREHWFLAVAAVSLALAGVTLVQAVAERGLLGPGPRVGLAVALGLALLVAGEAIRRRANDEAGAATALPAAFSGAGVVVLFSAVLAARTLYDLIGPETALVLLVGVAVAAVALGWLHGPLLAAVGIGGAMAAPFLVGGEAGDPTLLYAHFGVVRPRRPADRRRPALALGDRAVARPRPRSGSAAERLGRRTARADGPGPRPGADGDRGAGRPVRATPPRPGHDGPGPAPSPHPWPAARGLGGGRNPRRRLRRDRWGVGLERGGVLDGRPPC